MANDANLMEWDSTIEDDGLTGGFILLDEGDYDFTVSGVERGHHEASPKIPACNMAIVTLQIETPDDVVEIKEKLILYKTMEWKLSSFFRSIGMKKHGEKLVMNWEAAKGTTGRAHIVQREYTGNDGTIRKTNNVGYYIDYIPNEKRADLLVENNADDEEIPF